MTKPIPRDKKLDSTGALLRTGYPYLLKRTQRNQSDVFQTRFMGEKAICIHGQEAAKIFYDPERFERKHALPKRIQKTLMGKNGVHMLDDAPHRHRKAMFMSLMTPDSIQQLMDLMADQWQHAIREWEGRSQIILFEETREILCRAVCQWAGVPLQEAEVNQRAKELGDMVDAFGAVGPRHWKGRKARRRGEHWIGGIIEQVRNGQLNTEEGKALYTVAFHKDIDGNLLSTQVAAVELINVLRPIVAINYYITFLALALHDYPDTRKKLMAGDDQYPEFFVQEVRRFYPFAPLLGAYVRTDFDWQGYHFRKGTMVLLDVYGTLHDARLWERSGAFWPERFKGWDGSPFDFIPQGGGDHHSGHRCAGEWITIEGMKLALNFLTQSIEYEVPAQDLSYSLSRMPTFPKSGFIMSMVRMKA